MGDSSVVGIKSAASSDRSPQECFSISGADTLSSSSNPRNMGMAGLTFNLTNAVIGAGVLSLPFSVAKVGLGSGVILLSLGAFLSWWGLHLLNKVAIRVNNETNEKEAYDPDAASNLSFGSVASMAHWTLPLIASGIAFFNCIVMCIAYLNTFANFMVDVSNGIAGTNYALGEAGVPWFADRRIFILIGMIVVIPLSLPRTVNILKHTSLVAVVFVLYTTGVVIAYSFKPAEELCLNFLVSNNATFTGCVGDLCCASESPDAPCCFGPVQTFTGNGLDLLESFPVMINAFACSAQLFSVFNAFTKPTVQRMDASTGSAIALCLVLYVIIAVCGYMTYGATISDDLLSSYPLTTAVTVARFGIAIVVLFSYPLFAHVARDNFVDIVSVVFRKPSLREYTTKLGRTLFYVSCGIIFAVSVVVALMNVSLALLFSILGSICVSSLNFTLPGIFYTLLFKDEGWTRTRITGPLLITLGLVVMLSNFVIWGIQGI